MLNFTPEEKAYWAEVLRKPGKPAPTVPENYFDVLDEVVRKDLAIPASDGYQIPAWITRESETAENDMLYINIHGGGFVKLHSDYDHALCAIMAKEFHCTVIDIDYRLAPEYPYPTGMNDCCDAVRWIYAHAQELGFNPDRVVIGGNSAGGTFSADVIMRLSAEGHRLPQMVILVYPAANIEDHSGIDVSTLDLSEVKNRGLIYDNLYITSDDQFHDPYINLQDATPEMLAQFPDTVIVTGGLDPLAPGGENLARMLAVSGSHIVLQRYRNSKHGFYCSCAGDEWQAAREMVFAEIHHRMDV